MAYVNYNLNVRQYETTVQGKVVPLNIHVHMFLHYMLHLISENGLKQDNPYEIALRDLCDKDMFDDGSIFTDKLIAAFQMSEELSTYLSRVFENWKQRLKNKCGGSVLASLLLLFSHFNQNAKFVERPVRKFCF